MRTINLLKQKVLLILLLIAAGAVKAQSQFAEGWEKIQTGVSEHLFDVACINENEVIACGENGKILKSDDGGATWSVRFEKEGFNMVHVAFSDAQVGYACGAPESGYQCLIVKTTDGGLTWQELPNNVFANLESSGWDRPNHLFVVDADTFYLFGLNPERLCKTSDGGQSFTSLDFDPDVYIDFNARISHCELFFENETGYLVVVDTDSEYLYVLKTTNAGTTWQLMRRVVYHEYSVVVHFFDKNHIEILGSFDDGSYNLLVTENGFGSIDLENREGLPQLGLVSHAKFTSDTYGCILSGTVLAKGSTVWGSCMIKNGWENFNPANQGLPECVYEGTMQCPDLYGMDGVDTTFYIAAEDGLIYKSGMVSITSLSENVTERSVYPNPTTGIVRIDGEKAIEIQVLNALGQLVKTVQNTNEVNLHGLPQGIYLLRVALEDGTVFTDKVVKE